MKRRVLILLVLGVCLWGALPAGAAEKTKEPLLCIPIEQMECSIGSGCLEQTVENMRIPRFIRVDFTEQKVSGMTEGELRSTAIQNVLHLEDKTILQGAEGGRAWSIIINDTTYQMTASVADEQVSFSIFGSCLPLSAPVLGGGGKTSQEQTEGPK